eukprot:183236_1
MSSFRFFFWSMRKGDWLMIGGLTLGISIIGYSAWDYAHYSQREKWMPTPVNELNKPGRFGHSFPDSSQSYKRESKKQMSLDEIEWNIQDRQRRYQQCLDDNK